MRSAILVASLLATRVAAADDTRAELSAVGGSLYPLGAFIEQRICTLDKKPFIGCAHLAIGHQLTPADPMGHTVLDFSGSSGVQFERGRFDLTALLGISTLPAILGVADLIAWPFGYAAPAADVFKVFPVTANAGVGVGYRIVQHGRFRVRAEAGARAYVPLFTDSSLDIPTPHGVAATLGLGAGY